MTIKTVIVCDLCGRELLVDADYAEKKEGWHLIRLNDYSGTKDICPECYVPETYPPDKELRTIIDNAPHDDNCGLLLNGCGVCDCWKREALDQ